MAKKSRPGTTSRRSTRTPAKQSARPSKSTKNSTDRNKQKDKRKRPVGQRAGTTAASSTRPGATISSTAPGSPARPTATGPIGAGPIAAGPIVAVPSVPLIPDPVGNFFDQSRAGRPVVRPGDLLALRLELYNLVVQAGAPPTLRKTATGAAYITVHFPPQTITEKTYFEAKPTGMENPDRPDGEADKPDPPGGTEAPGPPPINARISGESRIVFKVPDGFVADYTLQGVLDAIEHLELAVPANARPPAGPVRAQVTNIFEQDLTTLTTAQRAALASFAVRSMRIAAVQGDETTLQLRQAHGGPGIRPLSQSVLTSVVDVGIEPAVVVQPRPGPSPAVPTARQTALEIPWRLILSPHSAERWHHAKTPVTSPAGRTELWHTRLVAPTSSGEVIEPPRPDPQRSVRAVWALTGEHSQQAMQSVFPTDEDEVPDPSTLPFRMPMDDFDRFQIVHLSSNFSVSNYTPNPVAANLLMLSTLGGWIDTRGAWDPPGLSVEEWVHRGTMGRDHYVRIVYKGFLYPFGHRVALVKVSERKFHNGTGGLPQLAGNPAYLRQRLFIVVRERERRFVDPSLRNITGTVNLSRQFPFSSIRILTAVTPNLDPPDDDASDSLIPGHQDQSLFWPCVGGSPFAFECVGTDLDGRAVRFALPMLFLDNMMASPRDLVGSKLVPEYTTAEENALLVRQAWNKPSRSGRRTAQIKQQRIALAQSVKSGDTSIQADSITFDTFIEKGNTYLRSYSNGLMRPIFYPCVAQARVRIAALAQLTGSSKNNLVTWNTHYLQHGFQNNPGQVFVDVTTEAGMAQLDFSSQGDRSGGFVQPNLKPSAISRLTGPVTGDVGEFVKGNMDASSAFPGSVSDLPLPLLFGCIPLGEVIEAVTSLGDTPEKVPKFGSEASTQVESFINGLVRLYDFVTRLSDQPGSLAKGALAAFTSTLDDQLDQAAAYSATLVADAKSRINQLATALAGVAAQIQPLLDVEITAAPALGGLGGAIGQAQTAVTNLRNTANAQVGGVSLPSGFRQSLLQTATKLEVFLSDLNTLVTLIAQGKTLFNALDAIVGAPEQLPDLLANPTELGTRLDAVENALAPMRTTVEGFRLLEGAPRKAIIDAIDLVVQVLGTA